MLGFATFLLIVVLLVVLVIYGARTMRPLLPSEKPLDDDAVENVRNAINSVGASGFDLN